MSERLSAPEAEEAIRAVQSATTAGSFDEHGPLSRVGDKLGVIANDQSSPIARMTLETLLQVAYYWLDSDDWSEPYGPLIAIDGKRTGIPGDLDPEALRILTTVAEHIAHPILRARVHDVLFLFSAGSERMLHVRLHLESVAIAPITPERWPYEVAAWDRAIYVGRRFGKATAELVSRLETRLRNTLRSRYGLQLGFGVADLLRSHTLGRPKAAVIARRLAQLGNKATEYGTIVGFREAAADWFALSGDAQARGEQLAMLVRARIKEAEHLGAATEYNNVARAAHEYELALRAVRLIPRKLRDQLGLADSSSIIARRIREVGIAQIGAMQTFTSPSVDVSRFRERSIRAVRDKEPLDALMNFSSIHPLVNLEQAVSAAEEYLSSSVLLSLASHTHFATDGRVIHRSEGRGGEPIYGYDPALWRRLVEDHERRIQMMVSICIWPAYIQISNEHRFTTADFRNLVRQSGIVPHTRIELFTQGLYLGYTGHFAVAAHLLVPQIENLVRAHLRNAGEQTSIITDGIEDEIALGALLKKPALEEVFPDPLPFEFRALLTDPVGPNLRNNLAHGLLDDQTAGTHPSTYLWWLCLHIVTISYWNAAHDVDAAEAQEPDLPDS